MKCCRSFSPQRQKTKKVAQKACSPVAASFPWGIIFRNYAFFFFFLNRKLAHILNSWSWLFVGGLMSSPLVYLAFSSVVNINPRFIFGETGCDPK